jgi:hypothetical protein
MTGQEPGSRGKCTRRTQAEKIVTCVRGFQPPTDRGYASPAANNASMEIARFILKNEAVSCNVGSQPATTPVS